LRSYFLLALACIVHWPWLPPGFPIPDEASQKRGHRPSKQHGDFQRPSAITKKGPRAAVRKNVEAKGHWNLPALGPRWEGELLTKRFAMYQWCLRWSRQRKHGVLPEPRLALLPKGKKRSGKSDHDQLVPETGNAGRNRWEWASRWRVLSGGDTDLKKTRQKRWMRLVTCSKNPCETGQTPRNLDLGPLCAGFGLIATGRAGREGSRADLREVAKGREAKGRIPTMLGRGATLFSSMNVRPPAAGKIWTGGSGSNTEGSPAFILYMETARDIKMGEGM